MPSCLKHPSRGSQSRRDVNRDWSRLTAPGSPKMCLKGHRKEAQTSLCNLESNDNDFIVCYV